MGKSETYVVCHLRDECRRRMVQGEFEVGGGTVAGLPAGHGGIAGPSGKLPGSPDSPVSDVNSILAGAHLQVGGFFISSLGFKHIMTEYKHSK